MTTVKRRRLLFSGVLLFYVYEHLIPSIARKWRLRGIVNWPDSGALRREHCFPPFTETRCFQGWYSRVDPLFNININN